jgi:hypothetical protein
LPFLESFVLNYKKLPEVDFINFGSKSLSASSSAATTAWGAFITSFFLLN